MTLPAGTTGILNDRCPWPERRGNYCIVAHTQGAEGVYPVHGLPGNEVVIYLPTDNLGAPSEKLANGQPWTCVTSIDSIDVLVRGPE